MNIFGRRELFKEPLKINELLLQNGSEMSNLEQSMVCGLIKKYKPQKIVEVGVAAGGTTAVILNCISMLEMDTEVYSVDISEDYYKDKSKKTGYLVEECRPFLKRNVRHKLYNGGYLPEHLENIGGDIDFLILDTVHSLPGEMIDFLAAFPMLKDGAVVVLHDIFRNHKESSDTINCYATRVLLSAVAGEKIIGYSDEEICKYIGLGVFRITQDTNKYIENLFSALMITWRYMPDSKQIAIYKEWFSKNYPDELLEEFDAAVELNKTTISRYSESYNLRNVYEFVKSLEDKDNVYIYGCGFYGEKMYNLLEELGIRVNGFVISDDQVKPCINKKIEYISELKSDRYTLILAMSIENQEQVCKGGMPDNWICMDEKVRRFLNLQFLY